MKVTQWCLTLCDHVHYTVHGILQAGILEWVAFLLLQGVFPTQGLKPVSGIAGRFFNSWATREALNYWVSDASNHLILCCPLLLLPSIFPSITVFSNELDLCIRWPKYWSFSFSISPSNGYSQLISFRIDWLDLLGVQGTLKSFLQQHSSKASVLRCSAFFIVQLSHSYMTTGKPYLWLDGPLLAEWCLCFLICCLGSS